LEQRLGKSISSVVAIDCRKQVVAGMILHIRLKIIPSNNMIHVRVYQPLHNEPIQLQNFKIAQIDDPLEILSSSGI